MKRRVFFLSLLVFFALISVSLDFWARRQVYSEDSTRSEYAGYGQMTLTSQQQIWVNPDESVPFLAPLEDKNQYMEGGFQVVDVPEQRRLVFAVGKVVGWEDVEQSKDKYLLLDHGNQMVAKYRLAFEEDEIFGMNPTSLLIEQVGFPFVRNEVNQLRKPKQSLLEDMGFNWLRFLVRKGDVVVVLPVFQPPAFSVYDEKNNYLADKIILRRLW